MDGAGENTSSVLHYHVVLLGKTGAGKSATGNTILGKKAFLSKMSFKTVTQEVTSESITKDGVNFTIYDTPGFFDPENEQSPEEMFTRYHGLPKLDTTDPLVCLLVLRPDRFTQEEKCTIEMIEDYLPDWLIKNTWIIFTRGDELEREGCAIDDLIADSIDLQKAVQKFDNRYFIFNNVTQVPEHHEVKQLVEAIKKVQPQIHTTSKTDTFLQRKSPSELETSTKERRLILLGKTGSGKSATGNTILRNYQFTSECNFNSVTKQCDIRRSSVLGSELCVVDTPGFSDSDLKYEDLAKEMANSVAFCSPGPHAFLYVVSLTGRINPEDENDIKNIEKIYGEEVAKYTIPVFTHSDQLEGKRVKDLIRENETLSSFVQQCGGRYHIMDNKDKRNRKQVEDLLQKIDSMIQQNGGHYTNQMFEEAQNTQDEEDDNSQRDVKVEMQSIEKVQETEESWYKRMWKKARNFFRKLKSRFIAVVNRLYSFAHRIGRFSNNAKLICISGDKSGKSFVIQINRSITYKKQDKTEDVQKLLNDHQ